MSLLKEKNRTEETDIWKQHIEGFKTSGLSRAAYCRKSNITYYRFKYWYQKLENKNVRLVPIKLKTVTQIQNARLPVICSIDLNGRYCLNFHDIKSVETILEKLGV